LLKFSVDFRTYRRANSFKSNGVKDRKTIPKLDVAGSIPVSRSIFNHLQTVVSLDVSCVIKSRFK
jgi:hypothetical protein